MGKPVAQNSSANVVIGPIIDASGSAVAGAVVANNAIVLVKDASTSAARNAGTSAVSVGPALYRIALNSTDTDTLGTLLVLASVSGGLPFRYDVEIWQSTTHALFYGTANQIATSANVSVVVEGALGNHDVATSADVSVLVSAGVRQVLEDHHLDHLLLTSVDLGSAVPQVGSLFSQLMDHDPGFPSFDQDTDSLAQIRARVNTLATSAEVSAIVNGAVWEVPATEPAVPISWGSVNRGQLVDWLGARSLNRHAQTATEIEIFTSAGGVIASASVANNSTSAVREQFIG